MIKGSNKLVTRADILDKAKQCVCQDRDNQYGSPEDNFRIIAALWSVCLKEKTGYDITLEPHDVVGGGSRRQLV